MKHPRLLIGLLALAALALLLAGGASGGEQAPAIAADAPAVVAQQQAVVSGDVNCGGAVDAVDALLILRHVAGLPVSLPPGCPPIGVPLAEADTDGDGILDDADL